MSGFFFIHLFLSLVHMFETKCRKQLLLIHAMLHSCAEETQMKLLVLSTASAALYCITGCVLYANCCQLSSVTPITNFILIKQSSVVPVK